ncbi:gluconate 2-dehydrogenase subunit 3 family protein [Pseudarthrobacter sp. SSS035]|uniref:gluconate 2-dehydrogenase subunit 3 family protein n=1 Tax=Pseudarthrobacter sp. SSS035 TaxID=2931399 RepID=UPI00200CC923|nr:gluconate 2-dehydrogenase subunit 3 family protein [Pseudarthrobacter sp. SSS035]
MPAPLHLSLKPPMGGTPDFRFSERHTAVFNAFADALIPAGHGFPAPSDVEITRFVARYITPDDEASNWYPMLTAEEIRVRLDSLREDLLDADPGRTEKRLLAFETSEPAAFTVLRDLVYFGYYSHPMVVRALNEQLPAGRDYHQTPQPAGYMEGLEPWAPESLTKVQGTYLRTEDVVPLATQPTFHKEDSHP